jgi:hypothetical protein
MLMPRLAATRETSVTGTQLSKIAFPVLLLAATGLALAKDDSQSVAASTTKGGTSVAPRVAPSPNGTKRENPPAKGSINPRTDAEETKDPYSVPLLQHARPLK